MSEQLANVEIAHKLHEKGEKRGNGDGHGSKLSNRMEILEAFLLAIVAVATAWSGFQSAKWDGRSAERYAQSAVYRVDGDEEETLGGQQRLQDVSTFNSWLQAKTTGDEPMRKLLERRFSTEYEKAFKAWLLTDPLSDPNAPPGPAHMPDYENHLSAKGNETKRLADEAFEDGKHSREVGEDYVRLTVFLATVLFLIAISQRFRQVSVQLALLGLAVMATIAILAILISYPRI